MWRPYRKDNSNSSSFAAEKGQKSTDMHKPRPASYMHFIAGKCRWIEVTASEEYESNLKLEY